MNDAKELALARAALRRVELRLEFCELMAETWETTQADLDHWHQLFAERENWIAFLTVLEGDPQ